MLVFLSLLWSGVGKIFRGIFSWIIDNPKLAGLILGAILIAGSSGWYFWHKAADKYQKQIDQLQQVVEAYKKADAEREAKIKDLEASSQAAADKLEKFISDFNGKLDDLQASYEKKLKAEQAKQRIVYVKGDTKEIPVYVEGDKVISNQLPDTFKDSVNQMVDQTNSELQK
jgi:septal ring factor EnvC (AmiA/AmiB activator)